MEDKKNLSSIVRVLEKIYVPWRWETRDPFKILISTILSQRTNWMNVKEAIERLENKIGISPYALAKASIEDIKECIRIAGLYNMKSVRIKEIAKVIVERFGGDLNRILNLSLNEARKEFLGLPGVGFKTADVVLLFAAGKPVFPVDTHIVRISKRIGIVGDKAGYEDIRRAWEKGLPHEKYAVAHVLLIMHGRNVCKSGKPLCDKCSISKFCAFYHKLKRGARGESCKK